MATESSRPAFHSRSLQEALAEAAPHLENIPQNLDAISEDIKTLERYLETVGVRVPVSLPMGHGEEYGNTQSGKHCDLSTEVEEFNEIVEWAQVQGKDRWRILYRKVRRTGTLQTTYDGSSAPWSLSWKDAETVTTTPLIETPLPIRLRGFKQLPQLLRTLGEHVTVTRPQLPQAM